LIGRSRAGRGLGEDRRRLDPRGREANRHGGLCADGQRRYRSVARGIRARGKGSNLARREHGREIGDYDVAAQLRGRVQGIEVRSNSPGGELMHLKGLLCGPSPSANRHGQFQPIRRDAPGQRSRGVAGRVCGAGFDAKFDRGLGTRAERGEELKWAARQPPGMAKKARLLIFETGVRPKRAESAPKRIASGKTGDGAIAAIPCEHETAFTARNGPSRCARLDGFDSKRTLRAAVVTAAAGSRAARR